MKELNPSTLQIYYEAVRVRDPRFDGKFFLGVKTTGIYCRPICPAKPKKENIEFFPTSLAAQKAGYRPCLRCRPESTPQSAVWRGKAAIVQRAMKMIQNPAWIKLNEDEFADHFGVSARHLRRVFKAEIGKTPQQLLIENRMDSAQKLILETSLPISEIVFVSGFQSIRRFNEAFKNRFKQSPRQLRRQKELKMKAQWIYSSPIGPLHLVASDKALLGIFWKKQSVPLTPSLEEPGPSEILAQTISQLKEYFAGKRCEFDLPLEPIGTPFQRKVWDQLLKIPYGKTCTYSDIAKRIQNPKAVRAVGTANGRNPISILIPCHRVIASDGTLGGYAGGLAIKTRLLEIEKLI